MDRGRIDRDCVGAQHGTHQVVRMATLGWGRQRRRRSARPAVAGARAKRARSIAVRTMLAACPLRPIGHLAAIHGAAATATTLLSRPPGNIRAGRAATARKSRHWLDDQCRRQQPGDRFREAYRRIHKPCRAHRAIPGRHPRGNISASLDYTVFSIESTSIVRHIPPPASDVPHSMDGRHPGVAPCLDCGRSAIDGTGEASHGTGEASGGWPL